MSRNKIPMLSRTLCRGQLIGILVGIVYVALVLFLVDIAIRYVTAGV